MVVQLRLKPSDHNVSRLVSPSMVPVTLTIIRARCAHRRAARVVGTPPCTPTPTARCDADETPKPMLNRALVAKVPAEALIPDHKSTTLGWNPTPPIDWTPVAAGLRNSDTFVENAIYDA